MQFAAFFGEEKPFPVKGTDFETAARWRYDTCRNARENCQSPSKLVQSLCAHALRPFKSEMKENFYHSLLPHVLTVDVHAYKNISLSRCRVPQKTVNL